MAASALGLLAAACLGFSMALAPTAMAAAGDAAPGAQASAGPVLVIHGGAGVERKDLLPDEERQARAALDAALRRGHAALAAGKPALDAVVAAITVLEDDPNFNAGKGAVFTHDGRRP